MGIGQLHTITNYFSVALVTLGIVFELVGRRNANEGAIKYGWNSLRLGLLFVILSLLTGLATEGADHIASDAALSEMFHKTVSIGFGVFVLLVVLFRAAFSKQLSSTEGGAGLRGAYLTLQVVSIALLLVTLVLGTRLVRTFGVGVAPVEKMNQLPSTPPPSGSTIPTDTTQYRQ
jgi:uncharacterized membrane protein